MSNTLADRLKEARQEIGLTQGALAKAARLKNQSIIAALESGGRRRSSYIPAIADVLGVHPLWLSDGQGDKHPDAFVEPSSDEFALVPQMDVYAACGEGKFNEHAIVKGGLAFKKSSLSDFGVSEQTARIVYASGGSMSPTIQDGCVVLLNLSDREPKDGKIYAICKPEGGLVLKRLVFDYTAKSWLMRSDNPDKNEYPDKALPPDDRTLILGRAIWNDNRL